MCTYNWIYYTKILPKHVFKIIKHIYDFFKAVYSTHCDWLEIKWICMFSVQWRGICFFVFLQNQHERQKQFGCQSPLLFSFVQTERGKCYLFLLLFSLKGVQFKVKLHWENINPLNIECNKLNKHLIIPIISNTCLNRPCP